MGFFIKIPNRYRHPIIIAYLLREKVENWCHTNVRREFCRGKLKDSELEECYYLLAERFTSIDKFCSDKEYQFVIKHKNGLKTFSNGPQILFDTENPRIFFEVYELYSIPRGVTKKITLINEILSALEITSEFWDEEDWEGERLTLEKIFFLENYFRIRFVIWSKYYCNKENRLLYNQLYIGNQASSKTCYLHFQEESGIFLMVDDVSQYFEKYFSCKNEECCYTFKSKKLLDAHEKTCVREQVRIIQEEYGPSWKLIKRAEECKLIPRCAYNRDFIFYDIESVLPRSNVTTEKTKVLSTHKLVSIAVNR